MLELETDASSPTSRKGNSPLGKKGTRLFEELPKDKKPNSRTVTLTAGSPDPDKVIERTLSIKCP